MQAKLTINGVDFTPFVVEDGIVQTDVERQAVRVVALGGALWLRNKEARAIRVSLRKLRDSFYHRLSEVLMNKQVTVTYTDRDTGQDVTAAFYVLERTAGIKQVVGGNTYWHNASFYLEAKDAK